MRRMWPVVLLAGCASRADDRAYLGAPPSVLEPPAPPPMRTVEQPMATPASSSPAPEPAVSSQPCPEEMAFVDTVHCPDTEWVKASSKCLRSTKSEPNHLTVCEEFAPGQTCRVPERRQRFCIDRYEYPSKKGAHPPVMVSAYDAAALCAEQGKRMCWESEWTAACEGPDKLPFPYGLVRSKDKCNIDNPWRSPDLDKVHHPRDAVRGPELAHLDQSVRSGAMETCKSGFGVYDLTGNFDEWVLTEWHRGKSEWTGLKGGAWGHVRNACRPITTSHVAQWSYYFISFRCCKDVHEVDSAATTGPAPLWTPPPAPTPSHPAGTPPARGWTPDRQ